MRVNLYAPFLTILDPILIFEFLDFSKMEKFTVDIRQATLEEMARGQK